MNVAVIGAGGWGTSLAIVLQHNHHQVALWGRDPLLVNVMNERRLNADYLPGVTIPDKIQITSELAEAVDGAEIIVLAVPSHAMRDTCTKLHSALNTQHSALFVNVAKGIEADTGMRMSKVIGDVIPN